LKANLTKDKYHFSEFLHDMFAPITNVLEHDGEWGAPLLNEIQALFLEGHPGEPESYESIAEYIRQNTNPVAKRTTRNFGGRRAWHLVFSDKESVMSFLLSYDRNTMLSDYHNHIRKLRK
jgi:hypothetical protein